ncbi:MAG: hypothetical protein ACRELY_10960 [Polyangiaceae bacterium]
MLKGLMRGAASILVSVVAGTFASAANAQSSDHVRVHIASDDEVFLQRIENKKWTDVCWAPCDVLVDADVRYRIEGPGVRPSSPFRLHATSLEGDETLIVNPSHDLARDTGFVLIGVGAAGLLAGLYLTWFGTDTEGCDGSSAYTECTSSHQNVLGVGLVTLVGSALVGGLGAVVAITSSHSSVHQMAFISRPKVRFFAGGSPPRREAPLAGARDSSAFVAPIVSVSF